MYQYNSQFKQHLSNQQNLKKPTRRPSKARILFKLGWRTKDACRKIGVSKSSLRCSFPYSILKVPKSSLLDLHSELSTLCGSLFQAASDSTWQIGKLDFLSGDFSLFWVQCFVFPLGEMPGLHHPKLT